MLLWVISVDLIIRGGFIFFLFFVGEVEDELFYVYSKVYIFDIFFFMVRLAVFVVVMLIVFIVLFLVSICRFDEILIFEISIYVFI